MASVTCTCSQVDCRAGTRGCTSVRSNCISTTPTIATGMVTVPITFTPYFFSATSVSTASVHTKLSSISYTLAKGGCPASYQRWATAAVLAINPSQVASDANFTYDSVPVTPNPKYRAPAPA